MTRYATLFVFLLAPQILAQGGQPGLSSVIFKPATVAGGNSASATILLTAPAGNNGFEVSLSITSNVAQLSSSAITIGSGLSSATVPVSTSPTATLQLATLTATARGDTRTANLTVAPPAVATLAVSPSSLNSGQQISGMLTLDGPAPAGGTVVNLTSNNAAVTPPPTVTIAAGQRNNKFSAGTGAVAAQTQATVTATAGGTSQSATVTVLPAPLSLTFFGFSTSSIKGGTFGAIQARINSAAPAGGATVQFTSTGTNVLASQPMTLTIPAGETSTFQSYGFPVTSTDKPFELTATLNGISSTKSGTLLAPRIAGVELQESIVGGNGATLRLTLNATPPSSGIPAVVTTSNSAVTVGSPIVATGQSYAIRTPVVTQTTPVTVTVSYLGLDITRTMTILPPPAVLTSITASPVPVRAGRNVTITTTLSGAAPTGGARVQFTSATIAGMSLPSSITVPAGSSSASLSLGTPSFLPGSVSVTLTGTYEGVSKQVTIRIDP